MTSVKQTEQSARQEKTCPFCGEAILSIATKCKHCGAFIERESPSAPTPKPIPPEELSPIKARLAELKQPPAASTPASLQKRAASNTKSGRQQKRRIVLLCGIGACLILVIALLSYKSEAPKASSENEQHVAQSTGDNVTAKQPAIPSQYNVDGVCRLEYENGQVAAQDGLSVYLAQWDSVKTPLSEYLNAIGEYADVADKIKNCADELLEAIHDKENLDRESVYAEGLTGLERIKWQEKKLKRLKDGLQTMQNSMGVYLRNKDKYTASFRALLIAEDQIKQSLANDGWKEGRTDNDGRWKFSWLQSGEYVFFAQQKIGDCYFTWVKRITVPTAGDVALTQENTVRHLDPESIISSLGSVNRKTMEMRQ